MISENVGMLRHMLANVKPTARGCLEWTGWRTPAGYGYYSGHVAHRVMYRVTRGEIPKGMKVLHSCDNPPCISPTHLSLGTDAENTRQSVERRRHHEARKAHCDRGHKFDGANTYIAKNGTRHCKTCARIRHRINAGWPEALARSAPAGYTGYIPPNLVRVVPPERRPHESSHCSHGHELTAANRYITRKGYAECRICREDARQRFIAKRSTPSGGADGK